MALLASNAGLRRRARDWATLRSIDARAVYLAELREDPDDARALVALAEIGDKRDRDVLRRAANDQRARVRAPALRALATLEPATARSAAFAELVAGRSGRVARAAAEVIRAAGGLLSDEVRTLEEIALDQDRSPGQRTRALALLRPARWAHLNAILRSREAAGAPFAKRLNQELDAWIRRSTYLARGPTPEQRDAILVRLAQLEAPRRDAIEFVLRTTT